MAVVKSIAKRTLSLSIARGQDADGNSVSKSYVYSNVKPEAEDAKLMAVVKHKFLLTTKTLRKYSHS